MLPDDILKEIFHWVVEMDDMKFATKRAVTLGVVCQRWRRVVLDTSTLWGRLNHAEAAWLPFSFERSRNAPLYISWRHESSLAPLEPPLQNMHRVKSLQFVFPGHWFQDLEHFLLQPSPILEVLSLIASGIDNVWALSPALATHSPSLRSLSLYQLALPWPASARSWKNLVHITIEAVGSRHPDGRVSVDDLIAMLGEMPLLETAAFLSAIRSLDTAPLSRMGIKASLFGTLEENEEALGPRIAVPRLQRLECTVLDMHAGFLLSRGLILPKFCSIEFYCDQKQTSHRTAYVLGCITFLSQGRFATELKIGRNDKHHFHDDAMVCVNLTLTFPESLHGRHAAGRLESGTPTVTVTVLGWRIPRSAHSRVIAYIWRLKCLQHIRTLRLAVFTRESVSWKDISTICSEISGIFLETTKSVDSFVAALEDTTPTVPPNLQHVSVTESCKLSLAQEKALADALRRYRRFGAGPSLQRLDVLSKCSGEVDWKGVADEVGVNELEV